MTTRTPFRPARPRRRTALAVLAAASAAGAALLGVAPTGAAPTGPAPLAAAHSAGWLADQVEPGGFVAGPGGTPSASDSLNVALALASAGVEETTFDAMVGWFAANVETVIAPGGTDDPGRIGLLLLIVDAAGADPAAFGGVDLVDRLEATQGDFAAGLYGAADPTFDGAYRQGFALLGLAAAGVATPTAALDWLVDQQCTAGPAAALGGWMPYRADTAVPCPAPDPDTFSGPDSNQTAVAVAALDAWGRSFADPLGFLADAQAADGGFAYLAGQGSDPNSTALVIQALLALGEPLADWAVAGGDPLASLLSWQLGCDQPAADVGAFTTEFSEGAPNLYATVQAVPAAAGATFPLDAVAWSAPTPVPCQAPPSSSTSSSTSTAPSSSTTSTVPPRPVAASPRFTG